jgi:hypothetical protein
LSTTVGFFVNLVWRGGWSRPLNEWLSGAEASVHDGADHGFGVPVRYPVPRILYDRLRALRDVPPRLKVRAYLKKDVRAKVRERQHEWRQLRFRLLRYRPEVFNEIDRLEADSEFRFTVALPVGFVGIAADAATKDSGGWYSIAGVALAIVLIAASIAVSVEAEYTMADLVADRAVKLPVLAAIFGEDPPAP